MLPLEKMYFFSGSKPLRQEQAVVYTVYIGHLSFMGNSPSCRRMFFSKFRLTISSFFLHVYLKWRASFYTGHSFSSYVHLVSFSRKNESR